MLSKTTPDQEKKWMKIALDEARLAYEKNEVPVGAVIVKDNQILAQAHNQTLSLNNPVSHAEILCINAASEKIHNHRLVGAHMYVTLEPCMMCIGALIQARVEKLIYATPDNRVSIISKHHIHKTQ